MFLTFIFSKNNFNFEKIHKNVSIISQDFFQKKLVYYDSCLFFDIVKKSNIFNVLNLYFFKLFFSILSLKISDKIK